MKIEHIREFLDLSETLNFSRSADRLYISQPTLSRHIKIMEEELGGSLVNTSSHGISLTKSGELAVASFRKIVREYDRFLKQKESLSTQVAGELRIGLLYYAMDDYFSDFLDMMGAKYPNVEFSVFSYQPQALYDDLMSEKVDVASLFFVDLKRHQDLRLQIIGKQNFIAMMRKDHPLASKSGVTLQELTFSNLIELKLDWQSTEITRELLDVKKLHFQNRLETDNIETVPMVIRKTGGIHLTGESCRKQNAAGICYQDIVDRDAKCYFCLSAVPGNDNPLITILFQEAKNYFRDLQRHSQ